MDHPFRSTDNGAISMDSDEIFDNGTTSVIDVSIIIFIQVILLPDTTTPTLHFGVMYVIYGIGSIDKGLFSIGTWSIHSNILQIKYRT